MIASQLIILLLGGHLLTGSHASKLLLIEDRQQVVKLGVAQNSVWSLSVLAVGIEHHLRLWITDHCLI